MTKLKSGSWPTRIQVATGKSNKDRGERESEGERGRATEQEWQAKKKAQ